MTTKRANFFDESIDRMQSEFDNIQKNFEKRMKRIEKDTQKRMKRLRKTPIVKRVESIRADAQKQLDTNVENIMKLLPVASNAEVKRLERKISKLSRKVTALERAKADRTAKKAPAKPTEVKASA